MAKKSNSFNRSQDGHYKLMCSWHRKPNTEENRAYGNYHADCIKNQRELGRVLSKPERKKLFSYWWNKEVKEKYTKYPF